MFQVEDTVPSIVLDAGSHTVKAGIAGEDLPHALILSHLSCTPSAPESSAPPRFGAADLLNALTVRPRPNVEVVTPFGADGLVEDWQRFESLLKHTLHTRLQVDTGEYAILYAEPNHNSKAARERLVELLFESFDSPATYLAKSAVLSAYASGRTTGVVLDVGHSGASAVPVLEGAVVKDKFLRSDVGGAAVSKALKTQLAAAGHDLRPRWLIAPGADATASFKHFAASRVLDEAKAALCRVRDVSGVNGHAEPVEAEWELPDGNKVRLGQERFAAAEQTLFGALGHQGARLDPENRPSYVQLSAQREASGGAVGSGLGGKYSKGVHGLVLDAVHLCDVSTHRDMYAGVCLTGGTSDMSGFYERISGGLAESYHKVRVLAATGSMERKYCTWTGGSILGTFSEFQKLWLAKSEYDEAGPSIVHRKCA